VNPAQRFGARLRRDPSDQVFTISEAHARRALLVEQSFSKLQSFPKIQLELLELKGFTLSFIISITRGFPGRFGAGLRSG